MKYGIYKATHTALEPPKELSEVIIADEFIGYPCIGSPIEVFDTEEAAVARLNEKYSSSIEKVARPIQGDTDKRFYRCTVFFVTTYPYSHDDTKEILSSYVPERIKIAEVSIERNAKVEPVKFVVEEQGKQVKIDGCKVTTKSDTVYFNCEDYEINFFVAAEFPEYKYYFDEDILEKMKEKAQRNHYQWYNTDTIIREETKTTWEDIWKFELKNKHNFNIKKKLIEENHSKVFENWSEHSTITKEDFITALEWLCNDPLTADGRVTREIGLTPTGIVKLARKYNTEGLSALYENGKLWSGEIFIRPCENEHERTFSFDGKNIKERHEISISCREQI